MGESEGTRRYPHWRHAGLPGSQCDPVHAKTVIQTDATAPNRDARPTTATKPCNAPYDASLRNMSVKSATAIATTLNAGIGIASTPSRRGSCCTRKRYGCIRYQRGERPSPELDHAMRVSSGPRRDPDGPVAGTRPAIAACRYNALAPLLDSRPGRDASSRSTRVPATHDGDRIPGRPRARRDSRGEAGSAKRRGDLLEGSPIFKMTSEVPVLARALQG